MHTRDDKHNRKLPRAHDLLMANPPSRSLTVSSLTLTHSAHHKRLELNETTVPFTRRCVHSKRSV